ncbi:hypothetical protein L873DRAFT_623014 [Choiromyces venosus 120613-1]|uniref:Uncharacterized protein n=1 Tax=Choiromyces venosus 120613-1 TaxID=1336337 RepID=A0A3N4IUV2_9PEZI|nr:hypothetical protein L873DRAFT_623014 [Choiromyces venosus 120613-1]
MKLYSNNIHMQYWHLFVIHSVGTHVACSSSSCSSLLVPIYCTAIYLPSYPLEHPLPSASSSAGQLSTGARGEFLKISSESETSHFLVQRVKFYDDSEAPEILLRFSEVSGSARSGIVRCDCTHYDTVRVDSLTGYPNTPLTRTVKPK